MPFNFLPDPLLVGSCNPAHSVCFFLYVYFLTFIFTLDSLLPTDHRTFSLLPPPLCKLILFPHAPSVFMLACSLAHAVANQECVCCPFDTQSDAIFRATGRAEPQTVASAHSMLAWLLFLSWQCSGHPGREPVQLLPIPSLYIRIPK